jgi:hypothetical protein
MPDDPPNRDAPELDLTDVVPEPTPLPVIKIEPAAAIPYYAPTQGDLPARAAAALRGFPHPTGPRKHWPLSEVDLGQLIETASCRAPIRRAAMLYAICFVCTALVALGLILIFVFRSQRANEFGDTLDEEIAGHSIVWISIFGGVSVLCFLAARGTYRCQLWAPIAMIVHFAGWVCYFAYQAIDARDDFKFAPTSVVLPALLTIPPAILLTLSAMVLPNINKFLRRPLWTIHLLISAKA